MDDTDKVFELMRADIRYDMKKKDEKYEMMNMYRNHEANRNYKMNTYRKYEKDNKYVRVRKSVLICCLFSCVMVITFLTVLVTKLLFEMKSEKASNISEEAPNNRTDLITTYTVGSIKTITTQKNTIKTIALEEQL